MLSKSNSSGHAGFTISGQSVMNKKKKPAPPRPPQPSVNRMQTSQSFSTSSGLQSRIGQRSMSISTGKSDAGDLIDFNTPLDRSTTTKSKTQEPPDFKYRVGASVFYVKSPLANSVSNSSAKRENPFSPPRPSAQALSRTNNNNSYTTTTGASAYISKPTIIKPQLSEDNSQSWNANQFKGGAVNASSNFLTSSNSQARSLYSNVPLEWDEPPKKFTPPIALKPTVIKPIPPPKKPGLGTKAFVAATAPTTFPLGGQINQAITIPDEPKPYYDLPPEFDDDDDDDDDDDFVSKPMPNEPPPSPPPNDVDDWVENTTNRTSTLESEIYSEPYARTSVADRAYAIALYDYMPEADGDLALMAGDLIYLSRKIDDSWLCGSCGGVEGMFPANYVNVVVPLPEENMYSVPVDDNSQAYAYQADQTGSVEDQSRQDGSMEDQFVKLYANIDYDFVAETESDLNLRAGEVVTILGRINEDWLYGEIGESRGQFPANFVSPVPIDLPILKF